MDDRALEILTKRFIDIARACGSGSRTKTIRGEFAKDVARYTERTRFYRTLDHVKRFLDLIDEHWDSFQNPYLACFAAVKHATIYDVMTTCDNTTLSALDASHTAQRLHFNEANRVQIVRFVLATDHLGNKARHLTHEEKLFADIDLDEFSRSFDHVLDNARKVRREFAHVSDDVFWKQHVRFLVQLELRGFIYQSPHYAGHEKRARENISEIRQARDSIVSARPSDKVREWP